MSTSGSAPYHRTSADVERMFDSIARRYDLLNAILSFGLHWWWQRLLVDLLPRNGTESTVLDLCTGTGALLPALSRRYKKVVGLDLSQEMLDAGRRLRPSQNVDWVKGDALELPFEAQTFDCITVAYGVRNFENLQRGLGEARRVIKVGGTIAILEFGRPANRVLRGLFKLYANTFIPLVGGLLTGDREAYRYLPKTIETFPCGADFGRVLESSGFECREIRSLSFGIAYLYSAVAVEK